MTREYVIRQTGKRIESFEIIPFKTKVPLFDGDAEHFDVNKLMKRIKSGMHLDSGYLMRACIASFCYGVYVRLLF